MGFDVVERMTVLERERQRLDRLLAADENWRALREIESLEAEGQILSEVDAGALKAVLEKTLRASRIYRARCAIVDAINLLNEAFGPIPEAQTPEAQKAQSPALQVEQAQSAPTGMMESAAEQAAKPTPAQVSLPEHIAPLVGLSEPTIGPTVHLDQQPWPCPDTAVAEPAATELAAAVQYDEASGPPFAANENAAGEEVLQAAAAVDFERHGQIEVEVLETIAGATVEDVVQTAVEPDEPQEELSAVVSEQVPRNEQEDDEIVIPVHDENQTEIVDTVLSTQPPSEISETNYAASLPQIDELVRHLVSHQEVREILPPLSKPECAAPPIMEPAADVPEFTVPTPQAAIEEPMIAKQANASEHLPLAELEPQLENELPLLPEAEEADVQIRPRNTPPVVRLDTNDVAPLPLTPATSESTDDELDAIAIATAHDMRLREASVEIVRAKPDQTLPAPQVIVPAEQTPAKTRPNISDNANRFLRALNGL